MWTNLSLWYLGYLLWQRFSALWAERHLPAYLGPSLSALISLALLSLVGFVTSVALGVMLITSLKNWILNRTTIEGWELERHEAIADRSSRDWWDISGPDGRTVRFERTEFPYDVGFFTNMAQAMGTANPILWAFPFAGNPNINSNGDQTGVGWEWPENGFNRIEGMWPPPDPDKIRQAARAWPAAKRDFEAELKAVDGLPKEDMRRAFKQRQEHDLKSRRMLLDELEEVDDFGDLEDRSGRDYYDDDDYEDDNGNVYGDFEDGQPVPDMMRSWTNVDGERLHDFGVDEETEDTALTSSKDDDIPLAELLRRRRAMPAEDSLNR